jgi:N-acetyl-anhydromuramyl-L-alanine amidase AmpD
VPTIRFEAASGANYTVAHRPSSAIRMVVVHVTESSALGAITWFRNPRAAASANYVVSGTGAITQMVPDSDIAWHAGNWAINRESIGVEHEGYTYRPGSFTDTEYRASARLVGYELRRYLLPIDRTHVIGHNEVPDPNHSGLLGGFAHHTDPGPNWNWGLYMRYVSTYAHGSSPAPHFGVPPAAKAAPAAPQITAKVTAG